MCFENYLLIMLLGANSVIHFSWADSNMIGEVIYRILGANDHHSVNNISIDTVHLYIYIYSHIISQSYFSRLLMIIFT